MQEEVFSVPCTSESWGVFDKAQRCFVVLPMNQETASLQAARRNQLLQSRRHPRYEARPLRAP